ncbi:MAG: hypothetical protein JOY90_06025 [Bradyrhizobium sp.]|uniref:hypothetical protein n=1 Tax=Bradyrhizobium sp. TaxID=376 RepID=UPI001DFE7833|nr:hypothetical protein [Bradyrhizobium sp.]MBV9560006.1 hypothetical protein [Bradyrhizobium sp.]
MRVLFAFVMLAAWAAPALAQDHVQGYGEADKEKSMLQQQEEKDRQRAYQRSLGNIPDKGPSDPWGAVRSNDAPKGAAAPAAKAKKTKTGNAN